ncbi:MAG: hypothetical protein QM658_08140 [Gordonia sp. (in: high G+C Gram-positive bacteria)]
MPKFRSRHAVVAAVAISPLALAACDPLFADKTPAPATVTTVVTQSAGSDATQPTATAEPTQTTSQAAETYRYLHNGQLYFTSPSGKWKCAILNYQSTIAGCHGPFPSTAPEVPASAGGGATRPNSIVLNAGQPGKFEHRGDPAYQRLDGGTTPVLPYGQSLTYGPVTCSIDQTTGVTCRNTDGHSFTVSDVAYELH